MSTHLAGAGVVGLIGIPLSPTSIVSALLKGVAAWIATGADSLVKGLGSVLGATTEPPLGAVFTRELTLIAHVALALAPIFLAAAVIDALLRQELSSLLRVVLLRAPLALVGSGVAIECVQLLMRATDALSTGALGLTGTPTTAFVDAIAVALSSSTPIAVGGFEAALLAVLVAALALALWLELAVRGAAIEVALLFIPLALAGVLLPATSHWARRLGETLFGLVISKLVIACVLALGVGTLGNPQGPSGFVEGIALLLLAALSPFSLLRLLPMVEAGAVGHLEGLGHRALQGGRSAAAMLPLGGGLSEGDVGPLPSSPIPMIAGQPFDGDLDELRTELFSGLRPSDQDASDG